MEVVTIFNSFILFIKKTRYSCVKKILSLLVCLCSGFFAFAIEAPQLRCVNVDANGNVTITWIAPNSTADFNRYVIYYSADGTTYSQLGQINNALTTTYTHTGANALNNPRIFYYITACSLTECAFSDTLSTLDFTLANQGNGLAVLNWGSAHEPDLPTFAPQYEIFREYPAGVWTRQGSTHQLIYRDTIDICESQLGYRVELADGSGCRNVSRIQSDIFSDMTAPDIPQLDSVSVIYQDSRIQLGWEQAFSPDVFAYIIYHLENGLWIPADTVYGIDNTTWTDVVNPSNAEQQYRVAALDSCMNSSAMSSPQHNIRLFADYDLCRREAYLNWEEYEGMPLEVENYQIFYAENGGPLTYAGQTAGDTRTFTLSSLVPQSTYDCIVRAVNYGGNVTAASTKCTFLFNSADNHDFVYIRYVSAVNNRDLEIKVSTGTTVAFSRVHLYRSVGDDQHFVHIADVGNDGTDTYIFVDSSKLRIDRELYFYRASIENECDVEVMQSNISHNILLKGSHNDEIRYNYLDWNFYDGWEGGVQGYQLYRKSESGSEFESVGGYMSTDMFTDDVSGLRKEGEGQSYYIEAEETADSYGFMEKSRSNTIILKQLPQTYIPNAFCPRTGGVNSVFLPIHSFVTLENYNMYIYSREGQLVFHTTDPYLGWNGGYNGNLMPAGCYVYKITYTYGLDGEYEAVGTVTLIR